VKKKIVILGGGEIGVGAAILCKQQGYDVFLSDGGTLKDVYKQELNENGILYEEGTHSVEKILSADEVMKSPGIPHSNAFVKQIIENKIPIISEMELAYRHKGDSKIIGITGSNGKTTTTALIYHICKTGGLDCALVGNIGTSITKQIALDPKPYYVVEISSFQLDDIYLFRPDIAIITNLTEDHLDRYNYNFENYILEYIIFTQTSSSWLLSFYLYLFYNNEFQFIYTQIYSIPEWKKSCRKSSKIM
jgi:UDP-N-acetylmuramoylalanine--D-glutamate ligase